jgi:hypothetical protein
MCLISSKEIFLQPMLFWPGETSFVFTQISRPRRCKKGRYPPKISFVHIGCGFQRYNPALAA